MGTRYLRQCESILHAQIGMLMAMRRRGTTNLSLNRMNCNYDGAYGAYRIENGMCGSAETSFAEHMHYIYSAFTLFVGSAACITRTGVRIDSFQDSAAAVATQNCSKKKPSRTQLWRI